MKQLLDFLVSVDSLSCLHVYYRLNMCDLNDKKTVNCVTSIPHFGKVTVYIKMLVKTELSRIFQVPLRYW